MIYGEKRFIRKEKDISNWKILIKDQSCRKKQLLNWNKRKRKRENMFVGVVDRLDIPNGIVPTANRISK